MSGGNNIESDPTAGSKRSRANRISFKHAVNEVMNLKEKNSGNAAKASNDPNSTVRISRPRKAPAKISPDRDTVTSLAVCLHARPNGNDEDNKHEKDQGKTVLNLNPIQSRTRTSTDDEGNTSCTTPVVVRRQSGRTDKYRRVASFCGPSEFAVSSLVSTRAKNEHAESILLPVKASDKSSRLNSKASFHVPSLPKVQQGKNKGLSASTAESTPRRMERLPMSSAVQRGHKDFHCKCCKPSNLESICYIGNDGKIAAAKLVGAQVHHLHQCTIPVGLSGPQLRHVHQYDLSGCFANASGHPSSKQRLWLGQQQSNPSQSEKSMNSFPILRDLDSINNSSLGEGSNLDTISVVNSTCCERSNIEYGGRNSSCFNAYDGSEHNSAQPMDIVQVSKESLPCDLLNIGLISRCSSLGLNKRQGVDCELNKKEGFECCTPLNGQPKCLFYHADNELSGTDDGTDVTTTPVSESQNTFSDLSNTDANILSSVAEHQTLKDSRTSRMRRKFLDALREQEAETVRLRKQEIQARKNAEDWMIDSAMEGLLHRLAPNGEACVRVLVEAFETVIHQSDSS